MPEIPATEFTSNFGQFRGIAGREPVAVISPGQSTGYFVYAAEFEDLQRLKALARRSRAVVSMTKAEIEQMFQGRMAPEHERLNALADGP